MANVSSSNGLEKYPKLRFKGFSEPWKTDTLGNLGTFMKGAPLSKADITEEGTPFILYGELYTTYSEVTRSIKRRTDKVVEPQFYSRVGDVIMPTSGETPEDIATASCIMLPDVILAGDLLIYRTQEVDGRLVSYVVKNKVNKQISSVAQGKSVVHVRAEELSKIAISYPSDAEQQKILTMLELLEEKMAKQRELIEHLKKYKRGLLKDILSGKFSTCGLDVATWEYKSLGELFHISAGGDIDKDRFSPIQTETHLYPVYANAKTNDGLYGYASYYKSEGNTITVSGRGEVGYAVARRTKYVPIVRLLSLSPKMTLDIDFYTLIINSTKIYVESTGVPQLTSPQLGKVIVPYIDIETQNKISRIFNGVDNRINKGDQELQWLYLLKQALLKNLFI